MPRRNNRTRSDGYQTSLERLAEELHYRGGPEQPAQYELRVTRSGEPFAQCFRHRYDGFMAACPDCAAQRAALADYRRGVSS